MPGIGEDMLTRRTFLEGAAAVAGATLGSWPMSGDADPRTIALVGGRLYHAPDASPITDGAVVMRDGAIASVGARHEIVVPADASVIDCAGTTITAAFWNCHVHFTGPGWRDVEFAPADALARDLRAMLTSWGVAHAVDTGSYPPNTSALRRRIRSGEIPGPSVMMASGSFVPPGGSPYYILPTRLPELSRPDEAEAAVNAVLDGGADAIKLFTGSWAGPRSIVVMSLDVVQAAVAVAHRRGKLVFAHPSNSAGARVAIDAGVDVLAHTYPSELDGPWDRSLIPRMRDQRMALIPTLKLWPHEIKKAGLDPAIADRLVATGGTQLRMLADSGGPVLFGTDVGYMTDYDPTDEYVFMSHAGLTFPQILATLTTAPAERFGAAARIGRLAPGMDADVVVIDGQPEREISALAKIRYTIVGGRVVYEKRS
jgi:imidazolonepropionase-like amidohydrolase